MMKIVTVYLLSIESYLEKRKVFVILKEIVAVLKVTDEKNF